jgi:hypothetical protein
MRNSYGLLLSAVATMLLSHHAMGSALTLSVIQDPSSAVDLNALTAGQTVEFDVELSGLDVADGQTLGALLGTIAFDGSLLGQPVSETPGPVVPDSSGFLTSLNSGQADGSYYFLFSNSGSLITANGTFFSFTVVVQPNVVGSGMLSRDSNNGGFVAAYDGNNNPVDVGFGADLAFRVGASAVPEPPSLLLATVGFIFLLARSRRFRS